MKCEKLSWSDVVSLVAAGLAAIAVVVAIAAVQAIAKGGCDCEGCGEQCEAAHEDLYMIAGELEDSHNRDIQELKVSCEAGRCNCDCDCEVGRCNCNCDCDCDCEAGRCDCEAGRCDCDCDCDPEPTPEPVVELEPAVEYKSSCPGGVCPQTRPSRRGLFGWRR